MAKKAESSSNGGPRPKPDSVPYDKDYRFPDDLSNVIRIWQLPPEGYPNLFREFVSVSGTSHRHINVTKFILGTERSLTLKREPAGPVGIGIAVYGYWREKYGLLRRSREREELLGYLPAELLKEIGKRDIAGTIATMYLPTGDKPNAGLRVNLWER